MYGISDVPVNTLLIVSLFLLEIVVVSLEVETFDVMFEAVLELDIIVLDTRLCT